MPLKKTILRKDYSFYFNSLTSLVKNKEEGFIWNHSFIFAFSFI